MSTIPWRGKTANHFSVGPGKLFDFSNLQSALDAVETAGDNTRLNRYVITIAPGVYITSAAIVHNRAFTDLVSEVEWAAVIVRDDTLSNGGTLRIGDAGEGNYSELVEDVLIYGMRLVRDEVATAKNAPESSLFLGDEEVYPVTVPWDQITLQACCFEGGHDALQFFGVDDRTTGFFAGRPPRVWFLQNVIRCQHDAVTAKGGLQMFSSGNLVHVNPSNSQVSPYLQNEEGPWKQTGFHFNAHRPINGVTNPRNPQSVLISQSDTFILEAEVEQVGIVGGQQVIAGIYFYDQNNTAIDQAIPAVRITDPHIRIRSTDDDSGSNPAMIGGIIFEGGQMSNNPGTRAVVAGGAIDIDQLGDGTQTPLDTWGVRCNGGTGTLEVRVVGTDIEVRTAKTAGNAYALSTGSATSTIKKSGISSSQAADPANAGTITELAAVADN